MNYVLKRAIDRISELITIAACDLGDVYGEREKNVVQKKKRLRKMSAFGK